jgi:hypothetical protein
MELFLEIAGGLVVVAVLVIAFRNRGCCGD